MLTKKFVCPSGAFDCPYWKEDGSCKMADEGENPVWECDNAMSFWNETEYEDDFEWFVWEDEKGNRYTVQELLERGYHFINGKPYLLNEIWACGGCDDEEECFEPGRPEINMFELNP